MSNIKELLKGVEVEWKSLGKCGKVIRGKRITKSQLQNDKKYPVISGGTKPLGYFDEYNREANTITIAQYGTAGFVNWQDKQFWANDVCYSIYPNSELNNKFLYYVLLNFQNYIYSLKTNAIPAHLPQNLLEDIQIPIPPLEKQKEIVDILDKFDTLTNSISEGLPKEIELRQKQYEYYRDLLLTFPKKEEQ